MRSISWAAIACSISFLIVADVSAAEEEFFAIGVPGKPKVDPTGSAGGFGTFPLTSSREEATSDDFLAVCWRRGFCGPRFFYGPTVVFRGGCCGPRVIAGCGFYAPIVPYCPPPIYYAPPVYYAPTIVGYSSYTVTSPVIRTIVPSPTYVVTSRPMIPAPPIVPQPRAIPQQPIPPAVDDSRTFPYDGGPVNPVPIPRPENVVPMQNGLPPVPTEGTPVRLTKANEPSKYSYSAYGADYLAKKAIPKQPLLAQAPN